MLAKLPKEVSRIMNALQKKGFEAYIIGECVRDSLLGRNPFGWDVATNAELCDMKATFPEAAVLSEKFAVLRFEYVEEIKNKDGEVEGEEGLIIDLARYRQGDIRSEAARRPFTIDSIAENQTEIVDGFGGREDIRNRVVRTVRNPAEVFREQPLLMLRAARLASQLGFDLDKETYEAIKDNRELLNQADPAGIRDEFTLLVGSAGGHAGKGLRLVLETGMIEAVLGRETLDRLSKRERDDIVTLSQNIDRTQPVEARRLGLFFACVDKKKILPVIERLDFDEETRQHLIDAATDMPKLYFASTKPALKKFIYERGWERYEYLASMEKAQRIVFDYFSDTKIKSKMHMLEEIKRFREPIFPEDLAIDENDLIEAGICKAENVEKILRQLTEEVHTHPRKNTREQLMQLARLYAKNKLAAALRGVHWLR